MRKLLQVLLTCACVALAPGSGVFAAEPAPDALPDPAQWRGAALARALRSAEEISDPYPRARALADIARVQAAIGAATAAEATLRLALTVAADIREADFRGWALHDIVEAQIAADDPIGARQTAETIESHRPHGAAFALVAAMQLRGGNIEGARRTALGIRERGARDHVFWQIAALQLLRGERGAAWQTAQAIREPFYRARTYGDIAVHDTRNGDHAAAEAAFGRVRKRDRDQVLARTAQAHAEQGEASAARELLNRIDDPWQRAEALARIIAARRTSEIASERPLIEDAIRQIDRLPDRQHRRARVLVHLARAQAIVADGAGARTTLERAVELAAQLPTEAQRDELYDLIARSQSDADEVEEALATALRVRDDVARALLVRDLVARLAGSGRKVAVHDLPLGGDPLLRAAAHFGVLGAELNSGDLEAAGATIAQAREAVAMLDSSYRPAALAALAGALVALGDVQKASQAFQEALRAAESIARPQQRAAAHVRIASAVNDRLLFLGRAPE